MFANHMGREPHRSVDQVQRFAILILRANVIELQVVKTDTFTT